MSKKTLLIFLFIFGLQFFISAQSFDTQVFDAQAYYTQAYYTPTLLLPLIENAPEINSRAAVLIDFATGALLYSKNPGEEIPPASLTKLMTMYVVMNEVAAGRASLDEIVPITKESWAMNMDSRSSLMFIEPRHVVTLREIMLGLAVSSGNDAAVAVALRFAPSVEAFASTMTAEASRIGLTVTRFVEPSGLSENNITTAAEYTRFCRHYLTLYPQNLAGFHSVPVFSYPMAANVPEYLRKKPGTITQYNRNKLLTTFPGVDGLKTGYIDESGYNIAITAEREGTRFIAVILGAENERNRNTDSTLLLTWAFDNFKTVRPNVNVNINTIIDTIEKPRLWKGKANFADIKPAHSADFTSPVDRANALRHEIVINHPLIAPLAECSLAGYLVFYDEQGEVNRVPLITAAFYEQGNFFKRIWHSIRMLFIRESNLE